MRTACEARLQARSSKSLFEIGTAGQKYVDDVGVVGLDGYIEEGGAKGIGMGGPNAFGLGLETCPNHGRVTLLNGVE